MNLDQDTLEKIIETHTNVKHILDRIGKLDGVVNDHAIRLREVEQKQAVITTKLALIATSVGILVTAITNIVLRAWSKMGGQ